MTIRLTTLPPIETARLRLRPLVADDTAAFQTMTDDPAITNVVDFLPTPFTLADARALIDGEGDGRDCFWGIWQHDGARLIGTVGTHLKGANEIEIGYWLSRAVQGHGFGTEAAAAIVRALQVAYPKRIIIAECRPDNVASWRLLEKVGFRADGRDGERPGRKRLVLA